MSFLVDKSDGVAMVRTLAKNIKPWPTTTVNWGKRFATIPNGIYIEMGDYSEPLWTAPADQTKWTKQKVYARPGYNGHIDSGAKDPIPDVLTIPPGFWVSKGTDGQADILLPGKGVDSTWGYRNYATSNFVEWAYFRVYNLFHGGGPQTWDAVAGSVSHIALDQKGNKGYWTPSMPVFLGVPTADEVEAELIPHVLGFTTSQTMGGPIASKTGTDGTLDALSPLIGTKYKCAPSPATMIESGAWGNDPTKGIMMGQRFYLNWTDAQLQTWVKSKPAVNQKAAQTFGRCLIDYGLMPTQSGPYDSLPVDGTQASRYLTAGVTKDILSGIDFGQMVALVPPTATYTDGTTGTREGNSKSFAY